MDRRSVGKPGLVLLVLFAATLLSCGSTTILFTPDPAEPTPAVVPAHQFVVLVVEENQSYNSIIGNAAMPYLNGLANEYGLATQYFASAQPSLPNYFMLTTGQTIATDNDFTGPVTEDNLVRRLIASGKTWKAYAESLPSVGYLGPSQHPYVVHHNPFAYFSDVIDSAAQQQNLVPFDQFTADLAADALPHFSFIIPNQFNNMHDCLEGMPGCTLDDKAANADAWLETSLGPLVSSARFQAGGLLIITFDESEKGDIEHGGGRVATVVVSPTAKRGFKSTTFYQHESTLRLILHPGPGGGRVSRRLGHRARHGGVLRAALKRCSDDL